MSAHVIVGERGTGKSLHAVAKIRDALLRGVPVATNMDLWPERMVPARKHFQLTRLADFPTFEDFKALGDAYIGPYDEKRFGLIVLDETAMFLNSREWAGAAGSAKDEKQREARARSRLIEWLRHSRKHHWHLILISQDLESLDAQVRRALAQFVVQCKRLDSYTAPFISPLAKLFGFDAVKLPQIHLGIVRLGSKLAGGSVDKWLVNPLDARELHRAYDTEQKIYGDVDGAATMLDARHAPYLWKPRGWREALWEVIGWRWWPPSEARARYDDARLASQGVVPSYKHTLSYAEWWAARAGRPGPLGAEGGEAAEPARRELLQEAA